MKAYPLILLALALLIFSGLNFWQSEPKTAPEPSVRTPAAEQTLFVPEGYRRLEDYTIVIDVAIEAGVLDSFHVIYGTEAAALDQQSATITNELGMGTAGEYGLYSAVIAADALEPGRSYFYRVVGVTTEGETLYSGLNRFTAGK